MADQTCCTLVRLRGFSLHPHWIGGGGLGATSCPGGGSPQCVQCVDVKCEYACAGGTTCDTDSWPEPGGEASLCSTGANCRTYAFGGAALASGVALESAVLR